MNTPETQSGGLLEPVGSADEAWRHYQDLYRRDVPVLEIEAAYKRWRELATKESQQPNVPDQPPRTRDVKQPKP